MKTNMRSRSVLSAAISAAIVGLSGSALPVFAQSTQGPFIEEIVVEARRVVENLQDVPLSLVAFSEESLQNKGIDDILSVQLVTPGLTSEAGIDSNTARFYIRGVGTATPTFGVEPAVPVYIDDVYTPSGIGSALDLFALQSLEVLRGPQGTLYGRNAFGGAIKVYTKSPKVDEAEGSISVFTGTESRRDFKAEYRTPLIDDTLWLSVGVAHLERDGYQSFTNGGEGWAENGNIFKVKTVYEPTNDLSFSLTYDKTDKDAPAKISKVIPGTQGAVACGDQAASPGFSAFFACSFGNNGNPIIPGLEAPRPNTIADIDVIETDVQSNSTVDIEGFSWTAEYNINDNVSVKYIGASRSLFNTRVSDIDGGPAPFLNVYENFDFETDSHELQLSADYGSVSFVAGLFRYEEETRTAALELPQPFLLFPDAVVAAINDPSVGGPINSLTLVQDFEGRNTGINLGNFNIPTNQSIESEAIYANVGWEVTDLLRLSLGVRHTNDDKSLTTPLDTLVFVGGGVTFTGDIAASRLTPPTTGSVNNLLPAETINRFNNAQDDYSETTIEFTADYRLTEDILGYASFRQGFQGGQLDRRQGVTAPGQGSSTESQKLDAFEVGIKSTLLDGRMILNAAAYYYDFEDLIVGVRTPAPLIVSATGFVQIPSNAGQANTQGLEVDLTYAASANLTINAGLSLIDFELDEVFDLQNGVPVNVADTFIDTFALTPETEAFIGADYTLPIASSDVRLFANIHYRDDIGVNSAAETTGIGLVTSTTSQGDANWISPTVTTVTAGATYTSNDGLWSVNLVGRNLTDKRRPVTTIFDATGFFGVSQQYNEPRTWELSVSRRF